GQVGGALRRALAGLGDVVAPARDALDLANAGSVAAAVREVRPDLVVNAAAYTDVDKAESEPEAAMAVNGIAPGVLAAVARECGAGLVHYSTDYVFDGRKSAPYTEDDRTAPLNVYGATKLAGEQAIAAADCPHLTFRTSWVYGPKGRNFLLTIRRLAQQRKELRVVADQFGAPTTARCIAEATAKVLAGLATSNGFDRDRFRKLGGTYHMTCAGRTSWHGFAAEILRDLPAAAVLRAIPATEYPTPAKRPANSLLDNAKLRSSFGIVLPDWKDALHECLRELAGSA
ncbi:MAG TPA: dTDP-4-dehydrorhamnose reductase, partial [Burkholderiales bacterium]|nr:dTDP-4-dehydrorhamnose reductase [Burkholderiales bacterium]